MRLNSRPSRESCLRKGPLRKFGKDVRFGAFISVILAGVFATPVLGFGQQANSSDDPAVSSSGSDAVLQDSPQAAQASQPQPNPSQSNPDPRLPQTKRILGIVPNFRA